MPKANKKSMTTLSVPIPQHLEDFINEQVKLGRGANKAAVVRRAIDHLREQEAITSVLNAQREPTLKGKLRNLADKL